MRLTRFSDIGLRVLIYLHGAAERTGPVTVSEIAHQFDLPINHLVKVVSQLSRLGWVQATRGRNGGLRLAADPVQLRIGAVLRRLEGEDELIDCEGSQCRLAVDCRLRSALVEGLNAFYDAMDRHSLADIAGGATGDHIVRMHRMFLVMPERSAA